jgi:hypothetical protein
MNLDGGVIRNERHLKGWALKSRLFWAQKSRDFRAHPSNPPRNGFPHPNPYVQPHINNRYIGNFMDKRQETRDKRQETRDFRAHSEMVDNKRASSLRGRIKGVEGWQGGDLIWKGRIRGVEVGGGVGGVYIQHIDTAAYVAAECRSCAIW